MNDEKYEYCVLHKRPMPQCVAGEAYGCIAGQPAPEPPPVEPPTLRPFVRKGPCTSCGKETEYACADCRIDTGKTIYVCESPICRDKHESVDCTRPNCKADSRPSAPAPSVEPLNELDKQEWRDIISAVRPDITDRDFDDMWAKFQEVKQRRSLQ